MGSAYLDLLPKGVERPRGAAAKEEREKSASLALLAAVPSVALRAETPQTAASLPSSPILIKPIAGDQASTVSPPVNTETLTVKELKKIYKRAKSDAQANPGDASKAKTYADCKARYVRAKEKEAEKEVSGPGASTPSQNIKKPIVSASGGGSGEAQAGRSTSNLPSEWSEVVDPSTGQTYFYNKETGATQWTRPTNQPGSGDGVNTSMARRLSRNRNKLRAAGSSLAAVVKVKRQSQSIVM
jgi:hypothetical protein